MSYLNDVANWAVKGLDKIGNTAIDVLGHGKKIVNGIKNIEKPQAYRTISDMVNTFEDILSKDQNPMGVKKNQLPKETIQLANQLITDLRNEMIEFDKDIASYKEEDHHIVLNQFITNCHNHMVIAAPQLTVAPTFFNHLIAAINEFGHWLGIGDIIDEKRVERNAFFKAHAKTRDVLVEEQAKLEP